MYSGPAVILASQSPRRKQLLEQAGIPFDVRVADIDETFPAGLDIYTAPEYIARMKAATVAAEHGNEQTIIAADTVVVLDDKVIGKPKDREDAIRILTALSGRAHRVITAVVILHKGEANAFSNITEVYFKPLTTAMITWYVDNYRPYDKAGAYAIQEWIGAVGIDRINGCFYNVMGLPVSRVVEELGKIA